VLYLVIFLNILHFITELLIAFDADSAYLKSLKCPLLWCCEPKIQHKLSEFVSKIFFDGVYFAKWGKGCVLRLCCLQQNTINGITDLNRIRILKLSIRRIWIRFPNEIPGSDLELKNLIRSSLAVTFLPPRSRLFPFHVRERRPHRCSAPHWPQVYLSPFRGRFEKSTKEAPSPLEQRANNNRVPAQPGSL